jgi:hypothetical protein
MPSLYAAKWSHITHQVLSTRTKSFHERILIEFIIYRERCALVKERNSAVSMESFNRWEKRRRKTNKAIHSTFFTKLLRKEHFDEIDNELFAEGKNLEREVEKLVNQFCCSFKLAPINQVQS